MTKVIVLGATGMLGIAVTEALTAMEIPTVVSSRNGDSNLANTSVEQFKFDAAQDSTDKIRPLLAKGDLIVNCIGIVKAKINEKSSASVENAIQVNSLLPHRLNTLAQATGANVIQIATDCVFDGSTGAYNEKSPHNPLDVYGKTKSLGEVQSPNFLNLRSSIIGFERSEQPTSLVEWVVNQPSNLSIKGYVNHFWNGVPSYVFGEVIAGIFRSEKFLPGTHHLVPSDTVTKFDLVTAIAKRFNRTDLHIEEFSTESAINRTLDTINPAQNINFWANAGYSTPPSVLSLVGQMPTN